MTVRECEAIAWEIIEGIAGFTAPQYEKFKQLVREQASELIDKHPDLLRLLDEIRSLEM